MKSWAHPFEALSVREGKPAANFSLRVLETQWSRWLLKEGSECILHF